MTSDLGPGPPCQPLSHPASGDEVDDARLIGLVYATDQLRLD